MSLTIKQYADFLTSAAGAMGTKVTGGIDTSEGSVPLAFLEATSLQDFFLQSLILQAQAMQRAATSAGPDLDSFFGDFNFKRLGATYNIGPMTFARNTSNSSSPLIPVGQLIQTNVGGVQYKVVSDASNEAYSDALKGYLIPANATSVSATAQAVLAGTASNVLAGQVTLIVSTIPGVDTVTNPTPINNAIDAESDTAARGRFGLWFSSLSKGTEAAIIAAIMGVQQGLSYVLLENQNFDGTTHDGYFTAIVEDGSGGLTTQEKTNIENAISDVRPFTIQGVVQAPSNTSIDYSTTAVLPASVSSTDASNAKASAQNAVASYIDGLGIGESVPIRRCDDVAIDAMIAYLSPLGYSTSSVSVNATALNSGTSDITVDFNTTARAGTIAVS